jgi:hypothetical protein
MWCARQDPTGYGQAGRAPGAAIVAADVGGSRSEQSALDTITLR